MLSHINNRTKKSNQGLLMTGPIVFIPSFMKTYLDKCRYLTHKLKIEYLRLISEYQWYQSYNYEFNICHLEQNSNYILSQAGQ